MHLWFCQFPKNSKVFSVGCVLFTKPWHHTLHISELKYPSTHGIFPRFLEIDKTAGAYSLHIYDYLSQIQRETNAFMLIVRHNTEGPTFSDWQWRHRMLFFFVGLKNRVNLVLFFKPWSYHSCTGLPNVAIRCNMFCTHYWFYNACRRYLTELQTCKNRNYIVNFSLFTLLLLLFLIFLLSLDSLLSVLPDFWILKAAPLRCILQYHLIPFRVQYVCV